ncbi:hypothetical protein ACKFKG_26075 [Phormidesmis sp. 146-35]
MSTSKNLLCSDCKKVTEHVKLSWTDGQGLADVMDDYFRKHPEDVRSGLWNSYPQWFKRVSIGTSGLLMSVTNGASNLFWHKDVSNKWICSICQHPQERIFDEH